MTSFQYRNPIGDRYTLKKVRIIVLSKEMISTITSKGQTTIPKEIRDRLNLRPGDRLTFMVDPDGKIYIQPLDVQVEELSGILYRAGRQPITVEQMNEAIQQHGEQ